MKLQFNESLQNTVQRCLMSSSSQKNKNKTYLSPLSTNWIDLMIQNAYSNVSI